MICAMGLVLAIGGFVSFRHLVRGIDSPAGAEKLLAQMTVLKQYDINVVVLNFVDMLSHARTENRMVKELANNEAAYRSITQSWMRHSAIGDLFRALAQSDSRIILTTDHGSIRTQNPVRVVGDRNVNTNLRYKLGKTLSYNPKEVCLKLLYTSFS